MARCWACSANRANSLSSSDGFTKSPARRRICSMSRSCSTGACRSWCCTRRNSCVAPLEAEQQARREQVHVRLADVVVPDFREALIFDACAKVLGEVPLRADAQGDLVAMRLFLKGLHAGQGNRKIGVRIKGPVEPADPTQQAEAPGEGQGADHVQAVEGRMVRDRNLRK